MPYILERNWVNSVKGALGTVLTTHEDFSKDFEADELDDFVDGDDSLFDVNY